MNAAPPPRSDEPRTRGPIALLLLALFGVLLFAAFVSLGTWQVYRLAWKRDLIHRVDERVHAPLVDAPAPAQWPTISREKDEYRRVRLSGEFLYDKQTYVWADSDAGSGYAVITPLRRPDGSVVLVDRGFVLPDWCGRNGSCGGGARGTTTVAGYLRMSEPGVFLRRNDPARDSWYTRDLPAMAKARGLTMVAPYYVSEDALPKSEANRHWPTGGQTVIKFPNNHLSYLITWYLLALMVAGAGFYIARGEYRARRRRRAGGARR